MSAVGIYVRVSRQGEREDERFHSPREQAERAAALAVGRGFAVGPTFSDIDVSGATAPADRPGMSALLRAIDEGELAGVAAYSLDRLSREPAHGDLLVRRVTKAGGVILTPDIPEAIDSPTGEFTFGMLLQVAKLYRSQAGARFASAKERAILAGIPVGPVPVGYRAKSDRTLEPDPLLAPAVRSLFERRAAGASWSDLATELEAATGRVWTRQGVSAVVKNRMYATGRLEYAGLVSEHEAGVIVDEPLWHAAQGATSRRPPRSDAPWLLTGLVRCGTCDHALIPLKGSSRRRQDPRRGRMDFVEVKNPSRRYHCVNRSCADKGKSVDAPRLERLALARTFATGDELATRGSAPDLAGLEAQLATAERRLSQVLEPEARDALAELWAADVKARRAERDAALAALGTARSAAGVTAASELRLRDVWEELAGEDRRAALALFWKAVRVQRRDGKTHVTFVARGPVAEVEVALPTHD